MLFTFFALNKILHTRIKKQLLPHIQNLNHVRLAKFSIVVLETCLGQCYRRVLASLLLSCETVDRRLTKVAITLFAPPIFFLRKSGLSDRKDTMEIPYLT